MRRRRFRPFRLGLWAGLIAGAAWLVQRYQRSRQELETGNAGGWSVVEATADAPTPRLAAEPIPDVPVVPVVAAEVVEVGDVAEKAGEPPIEPVPVPEPVPALDTEPAVDAAKKAPRKKAPAKKKAAPAHVEAAWVSPDPGGLCPTSHPVKAKLSSKLFHVPGMFAYARTHPDRCYRDEATAEADGLTKAKR
jgi:hypothetical protein